MKNAGKQAKQQCVDNGTITIEKHARINFNHRLRLQRPIIKS